MAIFDEVTGERIDAPGKAKSPDPAPAKKSDDPKPEEKPAKSPKKG